MFDFADLPAFDLTAARRHCYRVWRQFGFPAAEAWERSKSGHLPAWLG